MQMTDATVMAIFLLVLFHVYTRVLYKLFLPLKHVCLVCVTVGALFCAALMFAYWATTYFLG